MNGAKMICLWQPWASWMAMGVKFAETRGNSTSHRGLTFIQAAQRRPPMMYVPPLIHRGRLKPDGSVCQTWEEADEHNHQTWSVCDTITDPAYQGPLPCNPKTGRQKRVPKSSQSPTLFWPHAGPHSRRNEEKPEYTHTEVLPLGCVVAVGHLFDVVPIIGAEDEIRESWQPHIAPPRKEPEKLWWWKGSDDYAACPSTTWKVEDITNQRPFGDFTPGRHAHLYRNVQRLAEPVPARGHQSGYRDIDPDVYAAVMAQVEVIE